LAIQASESIGSLKRLLAFGASPNQVLFKGRNWRWRCRLYGVGSTKAFTLMSLVYGEWCCVIGRGRNSGTTFCLPVAASFDAGKGLLAGFFGLCCARLIIWTKIIQGIIEKHKFLISIT